MCIRDGGDTGSKARSDRHTGSAPGRRRVLAATGSAVGLSAAGCLETVGTYTGGAGTEEPITIGTLAPDPDSDFIGRAMARGAAVAVEELNENGGVLGRDVELVVGDTNSSPLETRRQYQRLCLQEGADVTVGIFDSPSLVNVLDDIAEQERIHLTTGAATSVVSRAISADYERYKYHFRVGPTNDYHLGRALADFLEADVENRNWDSVALLAEGYDWTEKPWDVLTSEYDSEIQERYPPSTDDFTGIYDEIADSGADVAFIATAHTGNSAMLDWSYPNRDAEPRERPRPQPFAFGGIHVPMQLPTYWERTNGLCEYGVSLISATANSTVGDLTQDFVSAYRDAYDATPVYTGYTTYEAIMLYAHVVERAGTLDDEELVDELEEVSFPGATGTIEFYDRDAEYPHDLVYDEEETLYFQWQENDDGEGVQEVIYPDQYKTADYQQPSWLR